MPLTKLDAVNEILESLGESAFTSIVSGSISEEASNMLAREKKRILTSGFSFNTNMREKIDLEPSDTEIAITGSISGTFQYGETIAGGTSSATGLFRGQDGSTVYLDNASGTFQSAETITGGLSSASFTSGTVTEDVKTGPIWVSEKWLCVKPFKLNGELHGYSWFTQEGLQIRDVESNSLDWSKKVEITRVTDADFENIPDHIARYIVSVTAEKFQQFKKRGRIDSVLLDQATRSDRIRMQQIESDLNAINLNNTHNAFRIRGFRSKPSRTDLSYGY